MTMSPSITPAWSCLPSRSLKHENLTYKIIELAIEFTSMVSCCLRMFSNWGKSFSCPRFLRLWTVRRAFQQRNNASVATSVQRWAFFILNPVSFKSLCFGEELGRKDIPSFETMVSLQLCRPNCPSVLSGIPDKRDDIMGLVLGCLTVTQLENTGQFVLQCKNKAMNLQNSSIRKLKPNQASEQF